MKLIKGTLISLFYGFLGFISGTFVAAVICLILLFILTKTLQTYDKDYKWEVLQPEKWIILFQVTGTLIDFLKGVTDSYRNR